tara:strand:+ start:96 stop:401 length:306 start_codon:yes stop_codon:yes gene_type:complete
MTDKIENLCLKIKNMQKLEDFILVDDEKNTITDLLNQVGKNVMIDQHIQHIKELINEDNPISKDDLHLIKHINIKLERIRNPSTEQTTEATTEETTEETTE